jgi:hypothetical protein
MPGMLSCAASMAVHLSAELSPPLSKHASASKPDELPVAAESVPNLAMVETVDSTKVSVSSRKQAACAHSC